MYFENGTKQRTRNSSFSRRDSHDCNHAIYPSEVQFARGWVIFNSDAHVRKAVINVVEIKRSRCSSKAATLLLFVQVGVFLVS